MNSNYTVDEMIGMIEDACLAIEEHGWLMRQFDRCSHL